MPGTSRPRSSGSAPTRIFAGAALIQECLYRLQALGMRRAYITGYSPEAIALYGSLGAAEEWKNWVYETSVS